jgi:uncharacterized protein
MFTSLPDLTKAALFYTLALTFALLSAVLIARSEIAELAYMFTPGLAVLLMLFVVTRDGFSRTAWRDLGLRRLGLAGWPLMIIGPIAVVSTAYAIMWASSLASIDPSANLFLVPIEIITLIVIMTVTLSLGEEIGWRGYLLPHLATLGRGKALLLSGFLHAVWHFPLIYLTSVYLTDGSKWITIPLFTVTLMAAGVLYGYVRFTTGSVWPAAIGHSVHNAVAAVLAGITISSPATAAYWLSEGGFLLPIGYTLVALWVAYTYLYAPARRLATAAA